MLKINQSLGGILWLALLWCLCAVFLFAQKSLGQQAETAPQKGQPAKPESGARSDGAPKVEHAQASSANQDLAPPPKRMFGMIPDFENTNDTAANRHPLTIGEKYMLSL